MESQEDAEMETAVRVFAHYLGVDLDTESDLIPAVRDAFYNLPEDWDIGIAQDDQAGIPFFTNSITGVSDWKHPREEMCIQAVKAARAEKEEREEERRRNRNKRDRDQQVRGRESDQNRRNNNSGRNAMPEVSEVVAMEDIVEDLEDIPSNQSGGAANRQQSQSARGRSASPTQKQIQEVKSRSASSNAYKGGFGMSSDDFLDEDEHVPADRRTSGGNHNTSQQQRSAVDNSLSPPLFKEMRSQNQAAAADYDSDDARNMRSKQGTTSTSLVTSHGTGLVDGAVSSGWASALGATQSSTDMDRDRERDRERDGARSVSNQRGRNSNEVEEHRGGGVSRGGRGGGGARGDDRWDRGGRGGGGGGGDAGDGRGRDQYRDGSRERDRDGGGRDTREARERDLRGSRDDRGDEGRFGGRGRGDGRGGGGGSERGASNQRGSVAFQASTSTTAVSVSNHVSDRERELKAEIDKYQVDVHKLSDDNLELAEKLALQRTKHANELSTLREDVSRLELRLAEERRERKVIEEQLTHAHAEHHSKARDLEDVHEIRLREAVRKARTDTEEEYREKVRTAERRSIEELDAVRAELVQLKRKCEEAQREADSAKRKISLSKADGRLEAQAEVDALRASLREAEETDRKQSLEMRRLREESAGVQGRLVGALQAVQLANAECDALRATAHTAVHDEQTHSGAVQAAMQRIQILDAECAQAKAENIILRREKEASALEIRKLRGTADFSGDRLNSTESEARRIKAQAQAETGRLQSRVTELEALTSVLRGQLDQAASHEAQAVREVSRECDTLDSEVQRLRDRLADREVKEEAFTTRIKTLEREAIRLQEILFKKDRQIRDEQEGKEGIQAQIESIRRGYESEIEDMKNILTKQKQANAELITHQRREAERLEQEISEKVPELIENAVSRAEAQWAAKHAKEVTDLKLQYEHQRDKLRAENHDLQTLFSEKEARQRLQNTEEKIELERLRQNNKITQRRNEDLEEQVLELRRQLRVSTNNSHYFGTPATSGAGASALLNRSGTGRHPPGRFPNTSSSNTFSFHVNPHHNNISGGYNGGRMSLDFSQALDQSFDNVRHSTGNPVPPPPPQYDARLDNNSNYNDENVYYDAQMQNSSMALQAGEDALMSHTVSFINDQLAFMKKQISSTLTAGNTSTGDNGFTAVANHRRNGHSSHSTYSASEESALVGADDAIDAINASVLGLPPTTTSTSTSTAARTPATFATSNSSSSRSATVPVPSSILSQHHSHNNHQSSHIGAHHHHHHVKFSPEALFHSPQHPSSAKTATAAENKRHPTEEPTSRPARQSDTAEYETQRQHQDQGQEQGEGQVEILDEHRSTHIDGGRSSGAAPLPDPPLSRGNANVRDAYADTSMLSDYSMNNFSTSYLDNPTSVNSTYNTYSSRASGARGGGGGGAGGGGGSYGIHSSGLGNADFSAISDGGYHEGYWRAKYQRTSKQ